jgi:stress-induced morphogen
MVFFLKKKKKMNLVCQSFPMGGCGGGGVVTVAEVEAAVRHGVVDVRELTVEDLSDGCGAKFLVRVVSGAFVSVPLLERHRMVQNAVGAAGLADRVHAWTLKCVLPPQ